MANPVVKIRPVRNAGRIIGHVVWCLTGDCEYADTADGKVAAQTKQRAHAYRHRTARNTAVRR